MRKHCSASILLVLASEGGRNRACTARTNAREPEACRTPTPAPAIAVPPRSVGMVLETQDVTTPRFHADFATVPVHSPGEKEPTSACQTAGEASEPCPECATSATHAEQTTRGIGPRPGRDRVRTRQGRAGQGRTGTVRAPARRRQDPPEIDVATPAKHGWTRSSEALMRPLEAGWWTSRTPTDNTIGCDGSGNLTVMKNGPTYLHGVTDCTIQHEQVHANDWTARYGAGVCTGRARGDLPHYDPPGQGVRHVPEQVRVQRVAGGRSVSRSKLAACTDRRLQDVRPRTRRLRPQEGQGALRLGALHRSQAGDRSARRSRCGGRDRTVGRGSDGCTDRGRRSALLVGGLGSLLFERSTRRRTLRSKSRGVHVRTRCIREVGDGLFNSEVRQGGRR